MNIHLGTDRETGRPVYFPLKAFERHLHLIGYTGAGKTTAIITLLVDMLSRPGPQPCVIIVDRLGGFSADLLRWFSSPFLCPRSVRDRLVYIEPAREDVTCTFNPLLYATPGEGYYRTARAAEIVLRGWDAQDLAKMPRLMRWLFNSMWAVAQLGLTLTDTEHLLFPNSPLHRPLLACLPEALRYEWNQIIEAKGAQAEVQLESTRNRLKPYFDSPVLRAMFASPVNRFDVLGWTRERKVVLVNLAPMGRLPETSADAIGGLIVNEVFSIARSLPPAARVETLVVLDEFQRFIGPDLEFSLAESRQLKTSLVLSHQSFSQLVRGDVDLTSLIFQAQSRLMLRVGGPDVDVLSEELGGFTFDPMRVKDEIWHRTQRVSGHRIVELQSASEAEMLAHEWGRQFGSMRGATETASRPYGAAAPDRVAKGGTQSETAGESRGVKRGTSRTRGTSQTLVPIYEEYTQLASRTYATFEEQRAEWGKKLRRLKPGQGILQIANDDTLYHLDVKRTAPAHLAADWATVLEDMPTAAAQFDRLVEENFAQACFVPPARALAEAEDRRRRVLCPPVVIATAAVADAPAGATDDGPGPPRVPTAVEKSPFGY